MDTLVIGLGPAFAAGMAVQQFLEFATPIIEKFKLKKKFFMAFLAFSIGMILAFGSGIRVLEPMGVTNAGVFDPIITGLIISAGSEGVNSVLKFLGYAKSVKYQEANCDK